MPSSQTLKIKIRKEAGGDAGNATTDGEGKFKVETVVDKHMLPTMDLDGSKNMDWFFMQWVYGTEVPRYRLDYTLTPESDGKESRHNKLTNFPFRPGAMV